MRNGIFKGRPCTTYKYEIKPNIIQSKYLLLRLGRFKGRKRSFVINELSDFSLKELEFQIAGVPGPIEVVWNRFRPDIINTVTISQELTGRYYVTFKGGKAKEPEPKTPLKYKRSRQSNVGRASIHYHP